MARPASLAALPSYLASQAAKNAHRRLLRPLAEHGLTLTHYAVLCTFADLGALSQGEVAASLAIDKSHVATTIDQLLEARLVERERDAADRRRYRVTLTREGRALLVRLAPAVRESQQAFHALPAREQALLAELLAKVVAADAGGRPPAPGVGDSSSCS
jgi:DNA-binding MarR family transcriptional regulator